MQIYYSSQPLVIGGLYDPKMQSSIIMRLSNFILTVDILNSIIEILFIKYINTSRFWKKTGDAVYKYIPNKEKFDKYIEKIKSGIDTL